jgi:hypothetical protein
VSPWVLLLFMGLGNRGGPVAIDMPSKAVCEALLTKMEAEWGGWRSSAHGWCIDRSSDKPQ